MTTTAERTQTRWGVRVRANGRTLLSRTTQPEMTQPPRGGTRGG